MCGCGQVSPRLVTTCGRRFSSGLRNNDLHQHDRRHPWTAACIFGFKDGLHHAFIIAAIDSTLLRPIMGRQRKAPAVSLPNEGVIGLHLMPSYPLDACPPYLVCDTFCQWWIPPQVTTYSPYCLLHRIDSSTSVLVPRRCCALARM